MSSALRVRAPVVMFLIGVPVLAQTPGRPLHREIPGDLGLGAMPQEAFASSGPSSLEQAAHGTGWNAHQAPSQDVFQPREAWETTLRELDRNTHSPPNAELQYREVFTPSVSPFKRLQSYDAVDELGRLSVRDPSLHTVVVNEFTSWQDGPTPRFTGDVQVRLSASTPTPIPSVAAEERIVSFETSPAIPVVFLRDSAGSLFVRGATETVVRLTYVLEAPQRAFVAPRLPAVTLPTRLAGTLAPIAPAWLTTASAAVLEAAQVRRDEPFDRVLSGLTAYFRAFRDEDLPGQPSNSLYRDLALGGVGACRHRAYAFVLTLHALGIPARYVNNEAHAWAEVAIPEVGWTRVDLGGWNVNLRSDNPSDQPPFQPSTPDPLPQPDGYANSYSSRSAAAPGDGGTGQTPNSHPDPTGSGTPGEAQGTPSGNGNGNGNGNSAAGAPSEGPGTTGTASPNGRGPGGEQPLAMRAQTPADRALPDPTVSPLVEQLRTTLTLASVASPEGAAVSTSVRGSLVVVEGEARDERDDSLANLPVEVVIQSDRGPVVPLGTTVTDARGRYRAQVLLPATLNPGEYSLRVRTQGDSRHGAASSN